MSAGRKAAAAALAVVVALGTAFMSRLPTRYSGDDDALLRLSWRLLGARVEECRQRTEEELAALAPHMRTPEVCTGGNADYELLVSVDGQAVVRDTVRPAGARADRPVYVLRELPLTPGAYAVDVSFRALLPDGFDPGDAPVAFAWRGDVRLGPSEVALVTLDPETTDLVVRMP